MTSSLNRQRGFSLLELMITITVAAILLVIAVPSFRDVIHRNQVSSASNALLAGLSYARTEAVNRGQIVSMCPSSDGAACTKDGQTFGAGWLVYTYPAGAASANKAYVASSDLLLRANDAITGVSIQSSAAAVITFGQQGQLRPNTALSFVTCFGEGSDAKNTAVVPGAELQVNASGSVFSKPRAAGASCTP
ncbi:MAG: GspH/FimT family pseudopilin [Rhodanobacter sp.]